MDKIRDETAGSTLLFQNPNNDFERGFAFAATTLRDPVTETIRARFFGGPGRNIQTPALVETGASDKSVPDDGRRVAAFCGEITLPPGGEAKIAIGFGQAPSRTEALAAAARVGVAEAENELAATRASWAERLGRVEVAPTGRTSTGWSTPGSPTSSTLRGSSVASALTSSAARPAFATSCRTCCR